MVHEGLKKVLNGVLAAEQQAFASLFGTADQALGMESFVANGPGKAEFS